MARALFISDLHWGATPDDALSERETVVVEWLRSQIGNIDQLFIVGDLFEFWFEYRWFIPKEPFPLLAALGELRRSGIEIHYLAGNHDFNLGRFFEEQLDIRCHHQPLQMELQGKKLWIAHGDGLASDDWKYRTLKRVLTHPISHKLWGWLHPDWGMALARWVGKTSRRRAAQPEVAIAGYSRAAQKLLDKTGVDVVVLGHTHLAHIVQLNNGLFVNTGEWIVSPSWAVMEEGEFRLERLADERPASS